MTKCCRRAPAAFEAEVGNMRLSRPYWLSFWAEELPAVNRTGGSMKAQNLLQVYIRLFDAARSSRRGPCHTLSQKPWHACRTCFEKLFESREGLGMPAPHAVRSSCIAPASIESREGLGMPTAHAVRSSCVAPASIEPSEGFRMPAARL